MNEIYPFEKEKKLIKLFSLDFGNSGIEYIKNKLNSLEINSLSELEEEIQLKIVFDLCYELYSDILSKESFMKKIKRILLLNFDKYKVYAFLFWRENFKHDSIEFLYHFFGKEISESLISIHKKNNKIEKINYLDEVQKFELINCLINKLTKDNLFIRRSLISNFTKYLIYGKSRSLKIKYFIKINKNPEGEVFLNNIKNYIDINSKKEQNNNKIFEVIDSLQNLIQKNKKIEIMYQSKIKDINLNEIKNMLSRYIGKIESNKIINKGLNEFSIIDINKTENYIKRNFVNFIIEKSEINSYSKQKQKMIKTLLFMLLKL